LLNGRGEIEFVFIAATAVIEAVKLKLWWNKQPIRTATGLFI
jgi:hypothetical protein